MTTTAPSSRLVVRQFFKHMGPGDYDSAMALISEDCDDLNPDPEPVARGVRG
jgi:hypothetical protein